MCDRPIITWVPFKASRNVVTEIYQSIVIAMTDLANETGRYALSVLFARPTSTDRAAIESITRWLSTRLDVSL